MGLKVASGGFLGQKFSSILNSFWLERLQQGLFTGFSYSKEWNFWFHSELLDFLASFSYAAWDVFLGLMTWPHQHLPIISIPEYPPPSQGYS